MCISYGKPFSLVHCDIWGPSKVTTCYGKHLVVMLIDYHTQVTWVYLLKEKHKVVSVFKNFYNMVQTQFHASIQIFRSDNSREYFTNVLSKFFEKKGIV